MVVTEGRRGTFVAASSVAGTAEAADAAAAYVATARRLGLALRRRTQLVDEAW